MLPEKLTFFLIQIQQHILSMLVFLILPLLMLLIVVVVLHLVAYMLGQQQLHGGLAYREEKRQRIAVITAAI